MFNPPTLDQDGYALENGVNLHREAPDTFYLPAQDERESVTVGDWVKLVFEIVVGESDVAVERMWVIVASAANGQFTGTLDNMPFCAEEGDVRLKLGDAVRFTSDNIIQILTVAQMDEVDRERAAIIEEITRDQALDFVDKAKDEDFLRQAYEAGFPVEDVLKKFGLSL